ncbi:MAG: hypothetical protein ACOC5T_01945 [Elusimicrobiota bacterium]
MADTSAEAEIRGIDIDKLAKGFAEEALVLKRFVNVSSTSAREIRWYQKTAGFITGTTTTGVTGENISNTAFKSRPTVAEQSWTRNTSYVRKYFVESPWLSEEDIKDSDIDVLATNVRDLVKAVANQVDTRIYNVITDNTSGTPFDGSDVTSNAATADGWDDASTGDPIKDLMLAKETIRNQRYDPEGAILYINPTEHSHLLEYLISVKGSSIPQFSSQKVQTGVVMEILGLRVVVSANATTDYAVVFVPNRACTWKQFTPTTAAVLEDPGIGRKIRVWEEGEAILTDPKAVYGITDTVV